MPDINALMNEVGIEDLGLNQKGIENTGTAFYEHLVGDYQAIVGKLNVKIVDKEGKECEKGTPGQKIKSVTLKLMVTKDPEMQLVDREMNFPDKVPYGRLIFTQYVTIDPNKQWQNIGLFSDFTSNGLPEASVVQGEKNSEQIFPHNLQYFFGCPCEFTVTTGTKNPASRFIGKETLKLMDHVLITTDLLKKRKAVANALDAKLAVYLADQKAKSNVKKEESIEPDQPVEDNFLDVESFTG